MKRTTTILAMLVTLYTWSARAEDEGIYTIESTSYKPEYYKKLHVRPVFLHEDKSFVANGGANEFRRTIELARKDPPQFLVEFILFPQLDSNNDLRAIKQWCRFFDSHQIPWIIRIWPDTSKAPAYLYVDPPEDAPSAVF